MELKSFDRTVAATGTPEKLNPTTSEEIRASRIILKAISTNTGNVFVGDASGQTYPLAPGAELQLPEMPSVNNKGSQYSMREIYLKVSTNGNGVHVLYANY